DNMIELVIVVCFAIDSFLRCLYIFFFFFFFFKQKTAYEIGLGIPAEPLFRSDRKSGSAGMPRVARLMIHTPTAISIFVCLSMVQLRSEERRVGKSSTTPTTTSAIYKTQFCDCPSFWVIVRRRNNARRTANSYSVHP